MIEPTPLPIRRFTYQALGPRGSIHHGVAFRIGPLNVTLLWFNRRKHDLMLRDYPQCGQPLSKRERALLERLTGNRS